MSQALVTIVDGSLHERFAEITMPTFRAYADRHGYDLVVADMTESPPSGTWSKAVRLRELIDSYEVVLWVDCDAAISPEAPDAARHVLDTHAFQALPFLNYQSVGLERDWMADAGIVPTLLSTGVWLVHQHPFAVEFFDRLFACTDLYDHPAAEAAAVWQILGADGGSAHLLSVTGTILLTDRWNSRETANRPHIFHATWMGAVEQPALRVDLLNEFVTHGTIADSLLAQRRPPTEVLSHGR